MERLDVAKHRLANVRTLAARYETQTDLAVALGMTKSGLTQLIGPNPIRDISERMARKFEKRLRLALGTLDQEPKNPTGIPDALPYAAARVPGTDPAQAIQVLDAAMRAADEVKRGIGAPITDEKYRQLVAYLYRLTVRTGGQVDPLDVDALVGLIRAPACGCTGR